MFQEYHIPKWQRELKYFLGVKSTFIIDGNINDIYPKFILKENGYDVNGFVNLNQILYKIINPVELEYDVLFCDPISGFFNPVNEIDIKPIIEEIIGKGNFKYRSHDIGLPYQAYQTDENIHMSEAIKNAIISNRGNKEEKCKKPFAIILNHASRYLSAPNHLDETETKMFLNLLMASLNANLVNGRLNTLFLIVDKTNDLPAWLYLNNPNTKIVSIPNPDGVVRKIYIDLYFEAFGQCSADSSAARQKNRLIDMTDGLKSQELRELDQLANKNSIEYSNFHDAVALFKYGMKDNPWLQIERNKIRNAEELIRKRIKGQDEAVKKAATIIKRAVTGLSGLQHSSGGSKPKGILFLAGPTGTGKTELAKALAEVIFGDEKSCIRFDMSEYQQSHSDQKLLGAPPGYVGYESGGQLTNAIKERPFSILLFDEIEKAHISILDKFLQILEDGRMTDGQGETVYFSESVIIFTSNLGVYKNQQDEFGNIIKMPIIELDEANESVQQKVVSAVKSYFEQLGRPELLNRIGNNNIIVFNFISNEAAKLIVKMKIENIQERIWQQNKIRIDLDEDVFEKYLFIKAEQSRINGGRGIGNMLEEVFINPVAKYIFDNNINENSSLMVGISQERDEIIIN